MTEPATQKCTSYPLTTILFLSLYKRTIDGKFQAKVIGDKSDPFQKAPKESIMELKRPSADDEAVCTQAKSVALAEVCSFAADRAING
jgi:hypothetical protein